MPRDGAALDPQGSGEIVIPVCGHRVGGTERGSQHKLCIVARQVIGVDVPVAIRVVPHVQSCTEVRGEAPAPYGGDAMGPTENAANIIAAGIVGALGGGVWWNNLQDMGGPHCEGGNEAALVIELVIYGRHEWNAARMGV